MRSGIDLLIALCVIFALSFVPPSFVMFLIRERATGAKHQQLVCGVNPVIYWISNYSWDMCNYMVTVVCIVIIFSAFGEDVYTSGDNFSAVTVLFILHGWAMIPLMYPATYIFTNSSTAYIVTMSISVLVGFVTTSTTLILQLIEQTEGGEVNWKCYMYICHVLIKLHVSCNQSACLCQTLYPSACKESSIC
jgi:ATP-binding cassette subfamily A (ABC1) protein 1